MADRQQSKRVIIHVGAHKTGTSLVQKYMRDKPEQINPLGIHAISRSDMNTYVGWGRKIVEHPEEFASRVKRELNNEAVNSIIASHENTLGRPLVAGRTGLYPRALGNLKGLYNAIGEFDVTIVLSIRPQVAFLQSYYLQLIHEGNHYTFSEWMAQIDTANLSWSAVAQNIRDVFGSQALVIVDFQEIRNGQEAYLNYFFQCITPGLNLQPQYRPIRNPSISEKGLNIALAANPFLNSREERRKMRRFLQKNFSNLHYPRPNLMSDVNVEQLTQLYDAEYRELIATSNRSI